MIEKKKIQKIAIISCFIFLIISLFYLNTHPPADGYELSIYSAFNIYFWLSLIIIQLIAISLIIINIDEPKNFNNFKMQFSVLIITNIIFLLLPIIRGYPILGSSDSDIFSHIGWIKDIAIFGQITKNDFYPIIHLFIYGISSTLSMELSVLTKYISIFLWMLYPIFMYLFGWIFTENKKIAIIIALFSIPLIFSFFYHTIHPSLISFIFLPLLFYISWKKMKRELNLEFTVSMIVMSIFIVFFHPITTLMMILFFITLLLYKIGLKIIKNIFKPINIVKTKKLYLNKIITMLALVASTFIIWYISFDSGQYAIISIFNSLSGGSEVSITKSYMENLNTASPTIIQTLRLIFINYGAYLLYIIFGAIFTFKWLIPLIRKMILDKRNFIIVLLLVTSFIFSASFIVLDLLVMNIIRSMRFFFLILTFSNGLFIYALIKNQKNSTSANNYRFKKPLNKIVVIILLISVISISFFNVYSSPIVMQPNRQYTRMNHVSSTWFLLKMDDDYNISTDWGVNIQRIQDYIFGVRNRIEKDTVINQISNKNHFGYSQKNDSLRKIFDNTPTYLITSKNGQLGHKAFPQNIQKVATTFSIRDLFILNNDQTANKLYDNDEVDIYFSKKS